MKRTIIIFAIAALLITGIYFASVYFRKIKDAQKLNIALHKFTIAKPLNSITDLVVLLQDAASFSLPVKIDLRLENFTPSKFTVNQIYAEIYTKNNILLAKQTNTLSEKLIVKPNNTDNILSLNFDLSVHGLINLGIIKQTAGYTPAQMLWELGEKYITTGKLGGKVIVKGFVYVENIKIAIPINETIEI